MLIFFKIVRIFMDSGKQIPAFYFAPKNLVSDLEGYNFLAKINFETFDFKGQIINIDFFGNDHLDANLCSPLGALIDDLINRDNKINLYGFQEDTEKTLKKNGFYNLIDGTFKPEASYIKVIDFRKFKLDESSFFQDYVDQQLLSIEDLPIMSQLLKKKINKSILEIFNNAHIHGGSNYIFTCGQLFSKEEKLKFTISDMGITIRKKVNDFHKTGNKIDGKGSILWAVEEGNTTKIGKIPGGLGLSLIRDFLKLNKGKLQIISSDGFWEENEDINFSKNFNNRYLGTIVNMEFNLNDKNSYILQSEIDPKNVL